MGKHLDKLCSEYFYHIFNRTNNREFLFGDDEDRTLFLDKYKQYVRSYVDTYSFCLLDNHFHLVVRVKNIADLFETVLKIDKKERTKAQQDFIETEGDLRTTHDLVEGQFTRFFTSYAMRFNKKHDRKGNLFYRPFKRIAVRSEEHFTWLIYYVNANSKKHKIQDDFQNYKWSSYHALLSETPTQLMRNKVLDWFGGREQFIAFHKRQSFDKTGAKYLMIED